MQFDNIVNIVDVESSTWETNSEQPKNEFSEIIEIGITEVDIQSLKLLRTKSILVKPQSSKISQFCTELTTLTQSQVDSGLTLFQACEELKLRFKSLSRMWLSWGDYDRNQFTKNCRDYNIKYPFNKRHMNIRSMFSILYGFEEEPNMEEALEYLELPLIGVPHRGDDDSKNIANIFISLLRKFRA
jgi:inhibitor of KinA sporulation pathway (predicted exonuclease)